MEPQPTPIDIARERKLAADDLLQCDGWQVNPDDITFINPALHGRWRTSPPYRTGKYWRLHKDRPEQIEVVEIILEERSAHRLHFLQMRAGGTAELKEAPSVQWWTERIRTAPH